MSFFLIIIFILIILLGVKSRQTETFIDRVIAIDDLRFGNYTQNDQSFMDNHTIKSFPLPLPLYSLKSPSENLSPETVKELDFVVETAKTAPKEKEIEILEEYITFCDQNHLLYNRKYLEQVKNDIKAFSYQLKKIYGRPRPYQLAFYLSKPLAPPPILSTTPSYPSYSTLLAKTLANVVSYNNPNYSSDLHAIAKEVELSRLFRGVNYPSDNRASLDIALIIKKYIKYFEIGSEKD
jgi:hypothetical protein